MDNGFSDANSAPGRGHGESKAFGHVPVLLKLAIEFLAVRRGGTYIDATLGLGGHSWEIAKLRGQRVILFGVDKAPSGLDRARERLTTPPPPAAAGEWPKV